MSAVDINHPEDTVDQEFDRLLSQLDEEIENINLSSVPNYRSSNLVKKIISAMRPLPCKLSQGLMP